MTTQQAIRLAVSAINEKIQRLAVAANLHDMLKVDNPSAVRASTLRKELREAIKILEKLK